MKAEHKSMNTYLKYTLILAGSLCLGGLLGIGFVYFNADDWGDGFKGIFRIIRGNLLPILVMVFIISVVYGEIVLRKMKALTGSLSRAEDEESDRLEYELDQVGNAGVIANNILSVLAILILSTGYSLQYISDVVKEEKIFVLSAFVIFVIHSAYGGYWQMRYVKLVQKAYPEKKGDPASRKFQQQWLESCDEAEKEIVFQGTYKSYMSVMKILPMLAAVSMITHLLWNTGIMAVFMVGIIWIVTVVSYCRACMIKKGQQIGRGTK
ncbi:MAG: DUF3169 family protein [Eubacteriales bacterium]|nr:DUF3169 family protein [Eubacteriales bacterium]